jgi:hypothetical protein
VLPLAACAVSPSAQQAAGTVPVAQAPALSPDATAALRRMSATVAGTRAFSVRVRTQREAVLEDGQRVLLSGTSVITARRPDRLTAFVGSDIGNFDLYYDGAGVIVLNPDANVYAGAPLTGDLLAVADWLEGRAGLSLPVRPLLAADPFAAMMEAGPTSGRLLGRSMIGNTQVEHYALRNPSLDWEIWLEANPRGLPRRVSTTRQTPQGPLRATIELDEWNLAPRTPDAAFVFVPPRNAVAATLLVLPEPAAGGIPR